MARDGDFEMNGSPTTAIANDTPAARHTLIPAVCDVSVTNVCNATCGFCSFAYDKQIIKDKRWLDQSEFARALPIASARHSLFEFSVRGAFASSRHSQFGGRHLRRRYQTRLDHQRLVATAKD